MLNILRKSLTDIEDARDSTVDRALKAANTTVHSAKIATEHLEDWAKDGLDAMKARPYTWGVASLGFGALIGGLYALWHRPKSNGHVSTRTMPARSRAKQTLRAGAEAAGAAANGVKKRARKPRRKHSPADA